MSDMNRRTFWKLLSGTGVTALLVKAGIVSNSQASSRYLRPPGALPEEDFLASCIRCGKCVKAVRTIPSNFSASKMVGLR